MQKTLRFLFISLLLSFNLIAVFAQDDSSDMVQVPSLIDSVDLTLNVPDGNADTSLTAVISGNHPDGCDVEAQSEVRLTDNTIDIQIYRELSPQTTCADELVPFEMTVEIDHAYESDLQYLVINDQVWEISTAPADVMEQGGALELTSLVLFPATIENVDTSILTSDTEQTYEFAIKGGKAVGCDVPMISTMRKQQGNLIIGLWNAVATDTICPAMYIMFEETITIPATELDTVTLVAVNDYLINELETQTMSNTSKIMTNINSVSVNVMESAPAQISIDVSGEHPDGCDYPVKVDQSRKGNTITVEIYRNVPDDVMCPMMLNPYEDTIKLDGIFTTGSYTIKVNSVTEKVDV